MGDLIALMAVFKTINPATGEVLGTHKIPTRSDVERKVAIAAKAFSEWRKTDVSERAWLLKKASRLILRRKDSYGKIITQEMGKPIREAVAEVEKCAWLFDYYAENAKKFLADEIVKTDAKKSYIEFSPLGVIGSIMPWNFPFWQALRFGVPALAAGNCVILKPSSTTPQSGILIEQLFLDAGFPKGVFQNIMGDSTTATALIESNIQGVSFTGSTTVGRLVGMKAADNLKKFVLELGGSDPFVVLGDADLNFTCKQAVKGRLINGGQSCIAAKRFIVVRKLLQEFKEFMIDYYTNLAVGDPMDKNTDIGPLANKNQLKIIERQVSRSARMGAKVLIGGKRPAMSEKRLANGYFYEPTILANVRNEMPIIKEEAFGPVMPIISVANDSEAIREANNTEYGLGASIWTRNIKTAEKIAREIEAGLVFVNSNVHSDPRMPFGGVKKSGIGRELSRYGLLEFVNIKSVKIS